MQNSISVKQLKNSEFARTIIDVRKPRARHESGLSMPGATWCHPFAAEAWAPSFKGHSVVVFCVHGHEVSKSVSGYLRDEGVDAVFLEGGFERWREEGQAVETLSETDE